MEWAVPVNDMLKAQITRIDSSLVPPGFYGDVRTVRVMQDSLSKIIDDLGEQSASAQGLTKVATTAEKLRNAPTHFLYLLKDFKAKERKGEVIGLLKVGYKHLFLFDEHDKVYDVEPLCVLDFYVVPNRQRHGFGKLLFDHMLLNLEISQDKLAIDSPSPKMEHFLRKNYGVDKLIRQKNNFAVSTQFFAAVPEIKKSGRKSPLPLLGVGRFAAPKPHSAIASVIHGGDTAEYQRTSNGSTMQSANGRTNGADKPGQAASDGHANGGNKLDIEPEDICAVEKETEMGDLQKAQERPTTLEVEPVSESSTPAPSPTSSATSRRDPQLTRRGYLDMKFYHNKLW